MVSGWWDRLRESRRQTVATGFGEVTLYALADSDGSLVRMLSVGGVLQSATYTDERWDRCPFAYLRAFDHLFEAEPALPIERVLMIGGAGFAYPKQLLSDHPGVKLDVVEIDPAMVALAREHFFLDRLERRLAAEGRGDDLRIFVEDGTTFLQDGGRGFNGYDVIINDAFVGRDAVPFFASDEGIAAAKARGTRFGRSRNPLPENFEQCREAWQSGEMTLSQAASACGMVRTSFQRAVARMEQAEQSA